MWALGAAAGGGHHGEGGGGLKMVGTKIVIDLITKHGWVSIGN
jgi:hypothetical protein